MKTNTTPKSDNTSATDILEAIQAAKTAVARTMPLPMNPLLEPFRPQPLGYRVYEEPLLPPKLELHPRVQVTDQCRREVNTWLLATFGRRAPAIPNDTVLVSERYGSIFVGRDLAGVLANIGAY